MRRYPIIKLFCTVTFVMAPLFLQHCGGVILAVARMTRNLSTT
jgi:hypothetical protein